MRRLTREEQAFCRGAHRAKGNPAKLGKLSKYSADRLRTFAYLLVNGERNCPRDHTLAVAVLEQLTGSLSPFDADIDDLALLGFVLKERNGPGDAERSEDYMRIWWLRSPNYYSREPTWTSDEQVVFLSRDDVRAFLNRPATQSARTTLLRAQVLIDPRSSRFDPAAGVALLEKSQLSDGMYRAATLLLEGRLVPADPERAEALLWRMSSDGDRAKTLLLERIEPRLATLDRPSRTALIVRMLPWVDQVSERSPALRSRLARVLASDLDAPDPQAQLVAARALARLTALQTEEAGPPLVGWADTALRTRNDPRKGEVRTMLARLVSGGYLPARTVLEADFARAGGVVEGGDWTPDPARPVPFAQTHATSLDDAYITVATRRTRRSWPEWPGRFVKVKLPAVQFRLQDCGRELVVAPQEPGAVVVEGPCPTPPTY